MEYSLLIAVAVAALLCMQFYVKRAVCGRFRQAADAFGYGRQFEPGVTKVTKKEPVGPLTVSAPVKSPVTPVDVIAY